jgi:hypothetical protein
MTIVSGAEGRNDRVAHDVAQPSGARTPHRPILIWEATTFDLNSTASPTRQRVYLSIRPSPTFASSALFGGDAEAEYGVDIEFYLIL